MDSTWSAWRHRAPACAVAGASCAQAQSASASTSSLAYARRVSVMRSRAVPAGTVGGRIAGTQKPRCHSAAASATASAFAPTTSGWIAVVEGSRFHRRSAHPFAEARDQRREMLVARAVAADHGKARGKRLGEQRRRGGGEDVGPRRLDECRDHRRMRGDERAGHARGLAERAHVDDALRREAEVRDRPASGVGAAPSTPKPCASSTTSHASNSSRERRAGRAAARVAVHAEHGVGGDELARRRRCGEALAQVGEVAMRIADEIGARQQRAVVEARVIEPVGEDRVAAPGEGGEDRQVGEIAARRTSAPARRRRDRPTPRAPFRAPRAPRSGRRSDATRRRPRPSAPRPRERRRRRPDGSARPR